MIDWLPVLQLLHHKAENRIPWRSSFFLFLTTTLTKHLHWKLQHFFNLSAASHQVRTLFVRWRCSYERDRHPIQDCVAHIIQVFTTTQYLLRGLHCLNFLFEDFSLICKFLHLSQLFPRHHPHLHSDNVLNEKAMSYSTAIALSVLVNLLQTPGSCKMMSNFLNSTAGQTRAGFPALQTRNILDAHNKLKQSVTLAWYFKLHALFDPSKWRGLSFKRHWEPLANIDKSFHPVY